MNNLVNTLAINVNTIVTPVVIAVAIAVVLGLLLAVASKFLYVEQDERVDGVVSLLPGYNCGACGKAGCQAFAEAIVAGENHSKISFAQYINGELLQNVSANGIIIV